MGDGGAGDADHTAFRAIDAESGEVLIVKGDISGGEYEVIGPLVQHVLVRDRDGNEVKIAAGGRFEVTAETDLPDTEVWTQLTAVGVTPAFAVDLYSDHQFYIVVASIGTTVDVRAEGSNDNTNWFNLDNAGVDTQYSADGTYMMHKSAFRCRWVRFNLTAEVGAAVTVDVSYVGGR